MKVRSLFLLVLAMLGLYAAALAQTVIDVGPIDIIKLTKGTGELSFYQQRGHQYRKVEIDVYKKGADRFKPSDAWQTYEEIVQPGEQCLPVNRLRSYSPKSFFKYLSEYQFLSFDVIKGDTAYYALQLFNPYKVLIRDMDSLNQQYGADEDGEWPRYYFSVKGFVILQLRPGKCMVLYQDKVGYFIPEKGRDHIFVKDYPFDTAQIVRQQQDNRWKSYDKIIEQVIGSYEFGSSDYDIDYTNHKEILMDAFGNRLLPDSYDSISKFRYFIFASKGGKMEVYNLFLKLLFKDVRTFTFYNDYPQLVNMLIGNKVIKADLYGMVNPSRRYSQVISYMGYSGNPERPYVSIDTVKKIYYCSSFFTNDNGSRGAEKRNDIVLPENITIQNATFYKDLFYKNRSSRGWFIVRKDGFSGLYFIRYPATATESKALSKNSRSRRDTTYIGAPVTCNELLPVAFDSIVRFDRYGYEYGDNKLLIYKKGLTGIYPLQTEAKYLSVDKPDERCLSRFELPDGRKGWLNLYTGKEYLDE